MVDYYQVAARRASYPDSIQILEADIQHANTLAASIPRAKDGTFLQMKLLYNPSVHVLRFLLQWMDLSCSCLLPSYLNLFYVVVYKVSPDWKPIISSHARKATIREFYTLVLPSLQRLSNNIADVNQDDDLMTTARTSSEEKRDLDFDRDEECGICLEPCTQMVLPNCCHAMCINCYRDWYIYAYQSLSDLKFTLFLVFDFKEEFLPYVHSNSVLPPLQENEIRVVPILSGQPEESELRRFVGSHVQSRRG
ncbi:E3 ubiquitin-protein ligase AIRP2-like isoform X3 [Diospyros lotus]|uniref:E3 ubiquitin-protein ligase AIRP2-like isoform X3 n=1 Tax=Diospyros lotus TaxID=55363 RepID=UPI0022564462|nr:E3 ubiquitin-protein ligase AIRP2-like isoform X3 [Diospyros lotus]